jgi:hypothetical protein
LRPAAWSAERSGAVGYRAPAIHELAVRVASGELDLESLKTSDLPTLELRKELLKIKGVGPYAAANLLLILGRGDFIPIDSWALKLVSHEWFDGGPVTPKQVEEAFEHWGEFKGLAFWFWDTGSTRDKMTDMRITGLAWGQMKVSIAGKKQRFKDCKVWPGGAREWRWEETGTHHNPGILPADIEEILKQNIDIIVFGCGQLGRLNVSAETEALLRERGILYSVEKTERAVQVFNELVRQGKRVGGLFHSTC